MHSKEQLIKERVIQEANYIIKNLSTVRATAKACNSSKSTVHKDLRKRLPSISPILYKRVDNILKTNKDERAIRGGNATRKKYKKKKLKGVCK